MILVNVDSWSIEINNIMSIVKCEQDKYFKLLVKTAFAGLAILGPRVIGLFQRVDAIVVEKG